MTEILASWAGVTRRYGDVLALEDVSLDVPAGSVLLFPLAFGGGLFIPPEGFPVWLDAVSRGLPTRAGRDLVVAGTTGADVPRPGAGDGLACCR